MEETFQVECVNGTYSCRLPLKKEDVERLVLTLEVLKFAYTLATNARLASAETHGMLLDGIGACITVVQYELGVTDD